MMLGELASNNHGGNEAAWISRMFSELPTRYPRVQGFLWYQEKSFWDFWLRPGTSAARAFAAGVSGDRYARNAFCRLPALTRPQIVANVAAHCQA